MTLGLERKQKESSSYPRHTAQAQARGLVSMIRQACKVLLRLPRRPQQFGIDTRDCLPFKELKCRCLYPLV